MLLLYIKELFPLAFWENPDIQGNFGIEGSLKPPIGFLITQNGESIIDVLFGNDHSVIVDFMLFYLIELKNLNQLFLK